MKTRRDSGVERFRTGGKHERRASGLEGFRTRGMRKGGIQERRVQFSRHT